MKYSTLKKRLQTRLEKLKEASNNWYENEVKKIREKYEADIKALEERRGESKRSHDAEIAALEKMLGTLNGFMEEKEKPAVKADEAAAAAQNQEGGTQ